MKKYFEVNVCRYYDGSVNYCITTVKAPSLPGNVLTFRRTHTEYITYYTRKAIAKAAIADLLKENTI